MLLIRYDIEGGYDGEIALLDKSRRALSTDLASVTIEKAVLSLNGGGVHYVTFRDSDNNIIRQHRLTP